MPPPAVSGGRVRALWQGAPWAGITIAGGLVLGWSFQAGHSVVHAVSALTGVPVWTAQLSRSRPDVLALLPGPGVVIVEVGREFGHAPALVEPVVAQDIALDLGTGRQLWTARVPGHDQSPPIAVAGNIVISGGPSGMITARLALSGRVLWQRPRPASCPGLAPGIISSVDDGMGLAAGGPLLAASFECRNGRMLVQRLVPVTGRLAWQWESPGSPGSQAFLSVTGVARQGALVLLAGQVAPPDAAHALAGRLPRGYLWPARLGPRDDIQVVLALNAGDGRPRWTELGVQQVNVALADGAVCESVQAGLECRDDVTGAATRPVLVTGQGQAATPPYADDGFAGISGSVAAVTVAPFRLGHLKLELVPLRGSRPVARAVLAVGTKGYQANYQTFVVAAGALAGGGTLLLLRRVDLPGYPLVALRAAG